MVVRDKLLERRRGRRKRRRRIGCQRGGGRLARTVGRDEKHRTLGCVQLARRRRNGRQLARQERRDTLLVGFRHSDQSRTIPLLRVMGVVVVVVVVRC